MCVCVVCVIVVWLVVGVCLFIYFKKAADMCRIYIMRNIYVYCIIKKSNNE
jgi:hypothetical protein